MAKNKRVTLASGTNLYAVDPTSPGTVHKICATEVSLNEGTPTKIDVTTLCETDKVREVDGLMGSSESTFTVNFDSDSAAHKFLFEAKKNKTPLAFAVGSSEGTDDPTHSGTEWTLPTSRTWWTFDATPSSIPWSFTPNSAVQPQITLTMDSGIDVTFKGA